jgi:hypothetical protein
MATATQSVPIIKSHGLPIETSTFTADSPIILPAVEMFDPPRPIPDARGSLGNERLKALAEKHQPPQHWYEGEEEQLF